MEGSRTLLIDRLITPQKPFHDPHSVSTSQLVLVSSIEHLFLPKPVLILNRISTKNVEICLRKHLSKRFDKFGKILTGQ